MSLRAYGNWLHIFAFVHFVLCVEIEIQLLICWLVGVFLLFLILSLMIF